MDNQVELPPEDSWFLREKEKAAALGDRVLGVACDIGGLTDERATTSPWNTGARPRAGAGR